MAKSLAKPATYVDHFGFHLLRGLFCTGHEIPPVGFIRPHVQKCHRILYRLYPGSASDFWDEKIVDNTFPYDEHLETNILADENVSATIPRFESFALASNGPQTKGVLVMGIDPDKEIALVKY